VGVDLPYDEPERPDLVVENDGQETPETIVDRLETLFLEVRGK
jgi:adenylylsulfate kinase